MRNNNRSPIALMVLILGVILATRGVSAQNERETGAFFGTIVDQTTRTPLYGASVSLGEIQRGTITGDNGKYTIDRIPPGTYTVRFSMVGYKVLVRPNVTISPGRNTELTVSLEPEVFEIESVTVTAKESYFEENPEAEVSGRTMDATEIMSSTGSAGDVQRVVQVLPSVVSGSDQYNEIIVRGGNYNENLFVMDGIEIPNPNHFGVQGSGGGPISLLRAEFINDVDFYAGAFPAKYGDRASSVLDISLRSGSRDDILTNIDMGMAGIGFMAEGPVGGGGSFLLSARKSYLDLLSTGWGLTAIPHYYNIQGKLTYTLGDNHTLLVNSVYGDDDIDIKREREDKDDWFEEKYNVSSASNLGVTGLTLRSILSESLISESVVSYARNSWDENVRKKTADRDNPYYDNRSVETETSLRYNLTWFWGEHELSGGFTVKNSRFDHDIFSDIDTVYTYDTSFATAGEDTVTGIYQTYPAWNDDRNVNTYKSAIFTQLRVQPINRLMLRLGARYDYLAYTGDGHAAPRIGARYRLTDSFWLNGAYGVHYQSPSSIDLTAHKDNRLLRDYRTDQFVIGTEWQPRPDTRITVEAYTKKYRDLPVALSWTTADPWDFSEGKKVNAAKGHSEGIELYLQRKMSTSYTYIVSYSLYRAWFEDPRTGVERPWDFDHRNVFSASFAKRWNLEKRQWYRDLKEKTWYKLTAWLLPFGDEVLLSAKWRFTGGRPYTEPTYLRDYHSWIVPEATPLNDRRFPDYHRLDIRLDQRNYYKNWSLVFYIDIMNVYGRNNIWDYERNEYGGQRKVYQFSTLPIGGVTIEF